MNPYRVTRTTVEEFAVDAKSSHRARAAHLNLKKRMTVTTQITVEPMPKPPKESEERS